MAYISPCHATLLTSHGKSGRKDTRPHT
jgi:hypothetical protein